MLKKIVEEDLLFSNVIEDDRTNTFVTLADYDWMTYTIKTRFRTKEQGILNIVFSYYGFTLSTMVVEQCFPTQEMFATDNYDETKLEKIVYHYSYDASIFKKHIVEFLKKHIDAWEEKYAFNGEDYVINFFNDVLENGFLTDGKHLDIPIAPPHI